MRDTCTFSIYLYIFCGAGARQIIIIKIVSYSAQLDRTHLFKCSCVYVRRTVASSVHYKYNIPFCYLFFHCAIFYICFHANVAKETYMCGGHSILHFAHNLREWYSTDYIQSSLKVCYSAHNKIIFVDKNSIEKITIFSK